jgi:hypothetical protein
VTLRQRREMTLKKRPAQVALDVLGRRYLYMLDTSRVQYSDSHFLIVL